MGFIEGKCKKCEGILQIPEDREEIICMYCGEKLDAREAVAFDGKMQEEKQSFNQEAAARAVKENYEEYLERALIGLPELLVSADQPLKNFRKNLYPDAFQKMLADSKEVLHAVQKAYMLSDNEAETLRRLARSVSERAESIVKKETKKRKQEELLMDFNVTMVAYVFPVILEFKDECSDKLVDEMIACWKEAFPKTNIGKTTYEQINAGFKKKLCYITTTLCEGLGKPDHCYELTLLRNYRDGYLMHQPGGEELVMEYYNVAPTIVKKLKKQPDPEKAYQEIWQDYLLPCIHYIEEDKKEACRKHYIKMVRDLQKQYVYGTEQA